LKDIVIKRFHENLKCISVILLTKNARYWTAAVYTAF